MRVPVYFNELGDGTINANLTKKGLNLEGTYKVNANSNGWCEAALRQVSFDELNLFVHVLENYPSGLLNRTYKK